MLTYAGGGCFPFPGRPEAGSRQVVEVVVCWPRLPLRWQEGCGRWCGGGGGGGGAIMVMFMLRCVCIWSSSSTFRGGVAVAGASSRLPPVSSTW